MTGGPVGRKPAEVDPAVRGRRPTRSSRRSPRFAQEVSWTRAANWSARATSPTSSWRSRRVRRRSRASGEHVADLGPGDFFGEMGLLREDAAQRHRHGEDADAAGHAHRLGPEAHGAPRARGGRARAHGARRAPPELSRWPARIVLFGATGYTGRLAAEAMVERGLRPVLAARSARQARRAGGASSAATSRPRVGRRGRPAQRARARGAAATCWSPRSARSRAGARPAAAAATTAGAHYIDSTGEPPFIREVFERYGPAAEQAGSGHAHRVRLRLGAGQPGRRARPRARRASWPCASTSATSSPAAAAR